MLATCPPSLLADHQGVVLDIDFAMQKRSLQAPRLRAGTSGCRPKKKRNPLGLRELPPKEEDGGVVSGTKDSPANEFHFEEKKMLLQVVFVRRTFCTAARRSAEFDRLNNGQ